jgi:hypothetical protein
MWRHSSIADSRPGPVCSGVRRALAIGPDPSALMERAPVRARHRGQSRPDVAIAGVWYDSSSWCILVQRGNVPTGSFQQDQIPGATGAATVSH